MNRAHGFYEIQSARAAVGELSEAELCQLERHADDCPACRECLADMAWMSREIFLLEGVGHPARRAGMHERFLDRAYRAGVSVSRSRWIRFDVQLVTGAVITILVALSLTLGWKFVGSAKEERASVNDSFEVPRLVEQIKSDPRGSGDVARKVRFGGARLRRGAAHGTPRSTLENHSAPVDEVEQSSPAEVGDREPSWSHRLLANYVSRKMSNPPGLSFAKPAAANLLGLERSIGSDEQGFHYELKLASISLLETLPGGEQSPRITGVKFSAPVLHLDPNWAW